MQSSAPGQSNKSEIDVGYVARLARLALTPEELALFQRQLADVVGYVRELETVAVDGVEPMVHAEQICNVMRDDCPRAGLARDAVLANAPHHDDEQFIVPKIV